MDSEGDEDSGAAVPFVVYVGGAGVLLLAVSFRDERECMSLNQLNHFQSVPQQY